MCCSSLDVECMHLSGVVMPICRDFLVFRGLVFPKKLVARYSSLVISGFQEISVVIIFPDFVD